MRMINQTLFCLLPLLCMTGQVLSANLQVGSYKLNVANLNKAIMNKEDQKTGIYALKHEKTGKFLNAYVNAEGTTSSLLTIDSYFVGQNEDNDFFSGIWYLDENLLDKHKAQLLVTSFDPSKDSLDYYACAGYGGPSSTPGIYSCAFDRTDNQTQQFILDRDQTNSSLVTITGNNRRDCYGVSENTVSAFPCDLPDAKWILYTQ
ncbi:MAG: hypothetical protein DHS80DRAFT_23984 [Piptocephalis tieghemiana]|nr:MAG: hypothetical protein DHS80DRAFT_23984 [Piptocephalis tieghemiana]